MTLSTVNETDLADIAMGAALLGTGGGGDPHIGRLLAASAVRAFGAVPVRQVDDLRDDELVVCAAMIGTPSVIVERIPNIAEMVRALRTLESRLGMQASAVVSAEMGGINSLVPIAIASIRRLPLIDGDGMGRAFPEIQMTTFAIAGNGASPLTVAGQGGAAITVEASDNRRAEQLVRAVVLPLGGCAMMACYPMRGVAAQTCIVPSTLTVARNLGRAIRQGRQEGDPFGALSDCLSRSRHYPSHAPIAQGRVVDVQRTIEGGWTHGACLIRTAHGNVELVFRNEFLLARRDDAVLAIVPDLIAVLDADTAEPITTDGLKYGQRVRVLAIGAPEHLKTPQALRVVGPDCFGLDATYTPFCPENHTAA